MKVLVAMSGGVDSSVAAAELIDQGHEVVGVTTSTSMLLPRMCRLMSMALLLIRVLSAIGI